MSTEPNGSTVAPAQTTEATTQLTQSGGSETFQLTTGGTGSIEEVALALQEAEQQSQQGNLESTSEENPEGNQEETPQETPEGTLEEQLASRQKSDEEIAERLKTAGIAFDDLANEFQENGDLSKESREKLAAAGYSENFVNSYIAGQVAMENRFISEVHSIVGGEAEFNKLLTFAKSNLSQKEADAFDKAVESGDLGLIGLSLTAIKAKQQAKHGTANKTLPGTLTTTAAVQGYKTQAEMTTAMKDKRYGRDAAYTESVIQKVASASF
ncbi:hypothetical protein DBR00_02470 [Pseudomonas sp. HMWF032]|uniref:capsid assembly protein n=1 Tax=Pseudomonas sp. HMWF032 TaxID=2056866 RepID=UPI000D3B277D|nr:hypothetical protein [Pseudomonas sp. HMWF032]PTS86439.1 hypothetical protein DBR00_02470 [Pseudomonas sp. HMWF032]PTT81372.1 hypothetical protein DBR41_17060 [Pseudomonas sp. HMWF010]